MNSQPQRVMCLVLVIIVSVSLKAMVPPHPLYTDIPAAYSRTQIELPKNYTNLSRIDNETLPNNILVLRVQFQDVQFIDNPSWPDNLVHNDAFFDRWMLHLSDFYADASHGIYELNYTLYPSVYTLPKNMSYYGRDTVDDIDVKLDEFFQTLFQMADQDIDFSQYGGIMIFHAGAGQESDINGIRTEEIWSTFLTRKRLQAWFDPDNDNYQGWLADGVYLKNIALVPENEFQDYFPAEGEPNADSYIFSIYGVLAQQMGHILGLPSLFDTDSSNGASQGIGNWGLMGTGIWNANGYVPAQLDPWCRLYLNWEPVITLNTDAESIPVDYFLNHNSSAIRLYKLPISTTEYFLLENRQQNPDGSTDPYTGLPSYSFTLLPEGEQDYYDNYPLLPYFNFMENRYKGSEWDFMLPGLGGPILEGMSVSVDGSGLLIWHIDERVIAQNFTSNFDLNSVNANATHKGIDLEEADGIEHLDTANYSLYKYGSPYDSFRADNNDYFGNRFHNGLLSLPTAESYYGGVPLEVYNISNSGNVMTFSVRFGWKLSADYTGENPINACAIDFDNDSETEIFYPMPDGSLHMWKNDTLMPGFPLRFQPVNQNYVWDGSSFYLPMQWKSLARLYKLNHIDRRFVGNFSGCTWATHPISYNDKIYLALNENNSWESYIISYNKNNDEIQQLREFDFPVASNMVIFRDKLYFLNKEVNTYILRNYNFNNAVWEENQINLPVDSTLVAIFKAPLQPKSVNGDGELIVQFTNSIYVFNNELQMLPGFPYIHNMHTTAPLTIADWDINGSLDLIITSDEGLAIIDRSGSLINPPSVFLPASDSLAFNAGAVVVDLDNDGKNELLGSFSNNRLICWEDNFRIKKGFPVSFGTPSRNMPFFGKDSAGNIYAWVASDDGKIYRQLLPDAVWEDIADTWLTEYGNLERHASRDDSSLPNQFQTSELFVPGEVYIYPNPLKTIFGNKLNLNVMTSQDTPLEIKIFDINGSLVYSQKGYARAYLKNRELIDFPEDKLHNGVYIAVISGYRATKQIKFAVEK
ncbi:MAG: immune inhibitor A domain-containing protein [Candidatus Cloacimonadaceae bacterium]|jgi:M6 family metalloprotease-like protein|nr:T9SS type A sorting domain-containing protein [Candidatus Cloacimonadota bacterium]MDY0111562.1 T9SS type A sorting domain-containing protein [Candidatus Syntrophosphaera sp.]